MFWNSFFSFCLSKFNYLILSLENYLFHYLCLNIHSYSLSKIISLSLIFSAKVFSLKIISTIIFSSGYIVLSLNFSLSLSLSSNLSPCLESKNDKHLLWIEHSLLVESAPVVYAAVRSITRTAGQVNGTTNLRYSESMPYTIDIDD